MSQSRRRRLTSWDYYEAERALCRRLGQASSRLSPPHSLSPHLSTFPRASRRLLRREFRIMLSLGVSDALKRAGTVNGDLVMVGAVDLQVL